MTNHRSELLNSIQKELFLVEGESAGLAVERVCNREFQAVLAMQGKPMNTWKASMAKVQANELFGRLIEVLGTDISQRFELERCKYDRVILLFDPDADGIHGCSLMLWFFYRWMPELLESGRIFVANPPICELFDPSSQQRAFPRHPSQRDKILLEWKTSLSGHLAEQIQVKPFRGLASLGQELLFQTCVSGATRLIRRLSAQDAIASLKAFGLDAKPKRL